MILTMDQIYRYMRHIAIPEISGQGQKKILASSAILFSEASDKAFLTLYYAAASGIGNIYCCFNDDSGWDMFQERLTDLNSDTKIVLMSAEAFEAPESKPLTRIVTGTPQFVKEALQCILKACSTEDYRPTIVSINNGWRGIVHTLKDRSSLESFVADMAGYEDYAGGSEVFDCSNKLTSSFSGRMAVIEHLKFTLSLGKPLHQALYYDLLCMDFDFISSPAAMLEKLHCKSVSDMDFTGLDGAKILIIGCGGLGSPAAAVLASSGVGKIGLVDFDTVELSNLNRQIMHSTSRIGMSKVHSAEVFLKQINPDILLETYNARINKKNVLDIISTYDVIISGLDNLPGRYVLNDACYFAGKPLIEAGALDISGLVTTIIPEEGHCYRCIFPESRDNDSLPSCSDAGVLGPVPGLLGIVQAAEAIKLLTGVGESLKNKILLFDVFDTDIYVTSHGKNRYCNLCSS